MLNQVIGMLISREEFKRSIFKDNDKVKKRKYNFNSGYEENLNNTGTAPIVGVCGAALGILNNWDKFDEHQRKKYILSIAESTDQIIHFINNIFDYAKLYHHKPALLKEPLNLTELLEKKINEQEVLNKVKGISKPFIKDFKTDIIFNCNKYYINELIDNLISYTFCYSHLYQVELQLTTLEIPIKNIRRTSSEKIIEVLKLTITYNSNNVIQKELEKVFSLFASLTFKKIEDYELWEIGFLLSKKIVELHKGKIWSQVKDENNIELCVILPIR